MAESTEMLQEINIKIKIKMAERESVYYSQISVNSVMSFQLLQTRPFTLSCRPKVHCHLVFQMSPKIRNLPDVFILSAWSISKIGHPLALKLHINSFAYEKSAVGLEV